MAPPWMLLAIFALLHLVEEVLAGSLRMHVAVPQDYLAINGRGPIWISGMIIAGMGLFAFTPWVRNGGRWAARFALALGILSMANGMGHLAGSVFTGHLLPGTVTSPLLVTGAVWLIARSMDCLREAELQQ